MLPPPPTETFASTSVCSAVLYKGLIYHGLRKRFKMHSYYSSKTKQNKPKNNNKKLSHFQGFHCFAEKNTMRIGRLFLFLFFFPGTWPSEASCQLRGCGAAVVSYVDKILVPFCRQDILISRVAVGLEGRPLSVKSRAQGQGSALVSAPFELRIAILHLQVAPLHRERQFKWLHLLSPQAFIPI